MFIKKNQYTPQIIFHPGETLAEKLEEMGLDSRDFAALTGRPEKTIVDVLKGKTAITPDLAAQFELVTLIPASFWINGQRLYDEFVAREYYKKSRKTFMELQPV